MRQLIYFLLLFKKALYIIIYPIFTKVKFIRLGIENYLIFQPTKIKRIKIRKELYKKFRPQSFITPDGTKIYGWFVPPKNGKPVFLHCHGQAESILTHQEVTLFSIKNGYGIFQISYRGHYKSCGNPSEKGIYTDAQAALNKLNELGIPTSNVIVWGHSLGSTAATETALNNEVKALILESPIKNLHTAAIDLCRFYTAKYKMAFYRNIGQYFLTKIEFLQKFDNLGKISKINCPILLLHSKADKITQYYNSMALSLENLDAELYLSKHGNHWNSDWCYNKITEFVENLK